MRLRYYLRGLAVGVVLTTIILSIANAGNKPLTDAQIRQRALALGMIESDSVRLSSLQGGSGESAPADDASAGAGNKTGGKAGDETGDKAGDETGDKAGDETGDKASAGTENETGGNVTGTGEVSGSSSATEGSELSGTDGPGQEQEARPVTFQVKSGASSSTVSRDLAAAGLVEDAQAFDTFLCNNGYSRKIHAGTYEILPGSSEEEIAQIIAY